MQHAAGRAAGMVWEPGAEAWEAKDAVWGEDEAVIPIGHHIANLWRKGAPRRRAYGAADGDRPGLRLVRDRWTGRGNTASLAVDADGQLPDIAPGVPVNGDDIGKWPSSSNRRAPGRGSCPEGQAGFRRCTAVCACHPVCGSLEPFG